MNFWIIAAIDVFATVANATADHFMLEMQKQTPPKSFPEWSRLQWYWHIAKWCHFNLPIGAFTVIMTDWLETAVISLGCYFIWKLVYSTWRRSVE